MSISKYRVGSTCMSCNKRISGPTIVVVTEVREDNHEPRAYLLHKSCESAMLRDIPFDDEPKPSTVDD